MLVLTIIGCSIAYIAIGLVIFGFMFTREDDKYDAPFLGLFWPFFMVGVVLYYLVFRHALSFGTVLGNISLELRKKRLEVYKKRLEEQNRLRVEVEQAERELEVELATHSFDERKRAT